ncbi:MAG: SpoIIE family protein phosphatase [Oscillospiraceae bacterium]|nr:SpoIIE family protein phosphatase [Oscillospiraceae bacterium]
MSDVGVFKRVSAAKKRENTLLRIPNRHDILMSALLFLAARASVLELSPFCTAMFGAVYDKRIGYLGMIVSVLGLILRNSSNPADVVKYIVAMTGFWLFSKVKEDFEKNKILSSAVCGALIIAGGICTLPYHVINMYNILLLLAEGILTAFSYIIFANASGVFGAPKRRSVMTQEETICICLCTGIFISGFSKIPLPFGLSLVSVLTMYCVISLSMLLPLAASGSAAVALGILCVQESDGAFSVMGMFGLCSIIASMLKGFGKIGAVTGFTAGCGLILLYNGNIPIKPAEVLICAAMVILTPKKLYSYVSNLFSKTQDSADSVGIERLREFIAARTRRTAEIFRRLSEVMMSADNKSKTGDIYDIFDDTAAVVCGQCGMNIHCWRREYNSTYNDMLDIFNILECKGTVSASETPEAFKKRCIHTAEICSNMTHIYELYKQNAMWEAQTDSNRALVARQYNDIADIMDDLSLDAEHGFNFSPYYEKYIEAELDKAGITASSINVLMTNENTEVLIDAPNSSEAEIRKIVSDALKMPMRSGSDSRFSMRFLPAPRYNIKSAYLREAKYGCGEYGDSIIDFSDGSSRRTIILSDGMGSGSEAKKQSGMSCDFLKEFICAGYSCRTSIDLLNSTLALKSSNEVFSTIDMIDIDLKSGYASFFKAGAAETLIMRDGVIDTVSCDALPIGMLNISEVSTEEIKLEKGDIIVMMSDGIKGKNISDNSRISEILYRSTPDPDSIAEKILADALKESDNMPLDDMSVIVLKVS